jgi:hypothetical protein
VAGSCEHGYVHEISGSHGGEYKDFFWDVVLMMEVASTSETSVNFYQTTRRNIPENSYVYGNEPSVSIKCGEFLDYLSSYQLLKKDPAPWTERWAF